MKRFTLALASLVLAGTLAIPAPASAHSISFGFGFAPRVSYCDLYPWDCQPRWRAPRARLSVDVGPFGFSISAPRVRTHIVRCEARFKSYDWHTDMYLGLDGDWHRCRL